MVDFPDIPGYKVKKKLGQGGMASVYMGVPDKLDRVVAIKIMHPHIFDNPRLAKRFAKEARTLKDLNHPNIVTIHDVAKVKNCNYIVMEYFQYNLKELIEKKGRMDPESALHIISRIADALFYAHKKNVIHRDVKPDNIMFRKDGTPVILDFGIAKHMDSDTKITVTGTSVGTPQYMSPEQCNAVKLDGRSDLYSLGVVFFEMLTGKAPYRDKTMMGIVRQHLDPEVPRLPRNLKEYQPIIDKLMAKEKRRRIRSKDSLNTIIKELLNVNSGPIKVDLSAPEKTSTRTRKTGTAKSQETVAQIQSSKSTAGKSSGRTGAGTQNKKSTPRSNKKKQATGKKNGGHSFLWIMLFLLMLGAIYLLLDENAWKALVTWYNKLFNSTNQFAGPAD
ncbi:MAG: serine/threonine protein kinase [bacterium]|nr:serine/threonine protein kinase [bacterium]